MLIKFRFLFFLLLACSIWFCFSQQNKNTNYTGEYSLASKYYADAEKLSAKTDLDSIAELKQEELNRKALLIFKKLIANPSGINDSMLFHCYVKAGLIQHYFDSLPEAKSFYLQAISLKSKLPGLADSFFFKPYLFAGSIFYSQHLFDSALHYYKKAEQIADEYNKPLDEMERLFNRMGAMYYETGNYRLANNYFQKAVSMLAVSNPSYKDLFINYKMNIASILVKLELYDKADSIFKSILPFNVHLNEINHNIGIINLRTEKYADALQYLRKVNYENNARIVEFYYNMADAFSNMQQNDSSEFYINKAIAENKRINGKRKNTSLGILLKFIADEKIKSNDISNGLSYYQQAICQFYPSYNDADIHSVPEKFSGVFSYIQLFNTLIAKGDAFKKMYEQTKDKIALIASFNAYRSAFTLADQVGKTYDSDEARLFLNKIKYRGHDKAIKSSLELYEITNEKYYLEEAFLFDQQNKASALTLSLQENNMQKEAGLPEELSLKQASIRSDITRLSLKAARLTDSVSLTNINNEIRDDEIKLARIQEQVTNYPKYAVLQPGIHIPSSASLQQMLDDKTSLLSYHLSETELLIFCINKHGFDYVKQKIDSNFFNDVQLLIDNLHNLDISKRYNGAKVSNRLYNVLITPLLSRLTGSNRLVIIPDDELNYVAFEALQDEQNKYLLQSFAVQYQFSTALLQLNEIKNNGQNNVLAFAPFTENIKGSHFADLPYSKQEVSSLKGKIFIGKEATKQHFIQYANKYPIVELATHAVADDSSPSRSFIAFYPEHTDSIYENILYAQEIYNLRLDSINLVILSACETGSGQLIRGEGLMSISRAFAYAGCPNIITSLWKAPDKTTAFITQQLHFYLDKGYSKDISLQRAKIDLLNNKEIAPAFKTPNYWAPLVLIGNYEPAANHFRWYWIIAILIPLTLLYLFIKKLSRRKAGQ